MGLSTSKQTQKSSSTTTPQTPDFIAKPIQDYTGQVANFAARDPYSFVAPASALQKQAFAGAANLGSEIGTLNDAVGLAKGAAASPVPQASASNAQAFSYAAPKLGNAAQVGPVGIAPVTNAQAYTSSPVASYDLIARFMDPAVQDYVNASLSSFDRTAAEQRAQLAAQGAQARAFGGNRWGLAESDLLDQQGMSRALLEAQLRGQAFQQALGAAGTEAGNQNQVGMANAALRTGVSQSNAGAANARAGQQATIDLQRGMANQDAANSFALHGADLTAAALAAGAQQKQQASMFNAQQATDVSKFNTQQQADAAARALQAAGLIGTLGTATGEAQRADLTTGAALGDMQRSIEQAYLQAPLAQLQAAGQLYGMIPYNAFVGQQTTGTSVQKSNPSLFDQALAGASTLASFVP